MDDIDTCIHLGASRQIHPLKDSHTICLWLTPHKMDTRLSRILQDLTGWDRPGKVKASILWTTDPSYKSFTEDPLSMGYISTRDLMGALHLMHHIKMINPTPKELSSLTINVDSILYDAFSGKGPRYFTSFKKANIYKDYAKESW